MSFFKWIISIILLSTLLYSSQKDLEKVSVQLNWKFQFEFAGFIMAKELGLYEKVGLDVNIKEFKKGINVIEDVKNAEADFGVYDASLIRSYTKEKPIVLLSNYFKRSALIFITKQDILTPEDLIDKKIMAASHELEHSSLSTLLKKFKIDIEKLNITPHSYKADEFINGSVDVMSAFISNELYHVKKSKVPYNIIDPVNYGIYGLGLNLFSTLEKTKQNPKLVQDFIDATNEGWKYALTNKEKTVDVIYNKYSKLKSKDALMFEAAETKKLMLPKVYPIGFIDKKIVKEAVSDLIQQDIIHDNINIDDFIFSSKKMNKDQVELTKDEKKYLTQKRKILMCVDPDWMPYERIYKGKHEGITSEYLNILEKKIGIPIQLVKTTSWAQTLSFAQKRKCDIISLATQTPSRLKYMNFTKPYLDFPIVLATKVDKLFISNVEDIIETKKIGIVKGYAIGEILKRKFPKNMIVDVTSVENGMNLVARGTLFGILDAMPPLAYVLQQNYIGELKIAGKLQDDFELGIAVRNDEPLLLDIFNKAINLIDPSKKQKIVNKYISVKFEKGFDYNLFWQVFAVLLLIIIYGVYRHRELILTKNKLQSSINSFEVLLNSVIEAIFVYEDEVCIDVNDVAVEMFGYKSKEEMIGLRIEKFAYKKTLKIVKENFKKDVAPYEVLGVKKNGEVFNILVKGRNTQLNNKKVRISTIIDTTTMKNQEKLLMQQSKMAAMGEMIDNIAHQWRQPLSLISTVSTGLELKLTYNTFQKEEALSELKNLNETTQHLSQTIDDFRNFFSSNKERSEFCVLKLINKNLTLFEGMFKSNNINIVFEDVQDVYITNYENELTQALLNVFYNAKDAMIKKKSNKFIFISISKDSHWVSIRIKDNGGGIKKEVINKIFEPYFTTKHKSQGTGIGLYMTHQIIERNMKGSIEASNVSYDYENSNYKGAQFIIKLPLK